MTVIYKITNKTNGKIYIGQSKDIHYRWHRHRLAAFNSNYPQYNCLLYKAMRKYGLGSFLFEVLEECDENELNSREQHYISHFDSANPQLGYNMITAIEYSNNSYLNEAVVEEIRQLLATTEIPQTEIANEFNTSQMTVSSINLGCSWPSEFYTYPIRSKKKHHYCCDCGIEISADATRCNACRGKYKANNYQLPIDRQELKQLIRTTPFTTIGKHYGVSDNAVRRWCDKYGLPRKAGEIKKYSDKEWETI
jgi:group I intron endonuclease